MAADTKKTGKPAYQPTRFMLPSSHYDRRRADRAVSFIQGLKHTKGVWAGKPFLLFPWQEQIIRSSTDKPPYFAVGFKSEKANHKYRYVWLYKVRAKPVTENYATKEGKSITRQTGEVEWTAIRRTHDNQYQAVADEDENGFTAAKGATFLQSVYEPVFTTGG